MTGDEIREWLNVPKDATLPDELTEGMKDVPYPRTAGDEVSAFRAFLACGGKDTLAAVTWPGKP